MSHEFTIIPIESKSLKDQFLALLNGAFEVPQGSSFFDDFPVWGEASGLEAARRLRLGGVVDGKLVSAAAVRLGKMRTTSGELISVALLGAVATDPAYRGKGYASLVVEQAVQWAERSGAFLVLLWGSEHAMYRRLDFELCGSQALVPLEPLRSQGLKLNSGWVPALWDMVLKNRQGGLVLESSDRQWFEAHRNVAWFWVGEKNRPQAYAALGRGIDMSGIVHEWGGERESLQGLLVSLGELRTGSMILGPSARLREMGFQVAQEEYLCLARVLNREALFRAFMRAPAPESVRGARAVDLPRIFFGPSSELLAAGQLDGLPVPLWVWGLDAC
ncbi:GNAT family N-acetyltransferase [Bdellovibrionota bacterium FG-2]